MHQAHFFCKCSFNLAKFAKSSKNFEDVEKKDHIRNFQPPVSGEEIMNYFNLKPCKEIGIIKDFIKESILNGDITNSYDEAKELMVDSTGINGPANWEIGSYKDGEENLPVTGISWYEAQAYAKYKGNIPVSYTHLTLPTKA